ncbi:Protein of uncharacterised function (DUF3421) [Legionella busanensis]|uniref:Protein of uncharacterized function (DUF3421) n=1 Tax=Legionella busanensis TaxID=190655 RepID=A0A378JGJ8_9GAMM|nr:DUF3421 domain-containing protein [Legionella busanensis]STX50244.1 Protein of uncharacterised function (DUF3421) [Legionella busanensis]
MRMLSILFLALGIQVGWANPPHVHGHPDSPSLEQAIRVGTDTDGKALYLCIANLFNSVQPGKTWVGYGRCNIAYGGKEYIVNDFKVPPRNLFNNTSWQKDTRSPVRIGRDTNGKPLFLCQALYRGSKQPGKTWPGYNRCNISYAGQEVVLNIFQVLGNGRVNQHAHAHNPNNHSHGPTSSQVIVTEY